jgi:hypothetical protein
MLIRLRTAVASIFFILIAVSGELGSTCKGNFNYSFPSIKKSRIQSINDVKEMFRMYDESINWPSVCLIVRTFQRDFPILRHILRSYDIFWPSNIGQKIIVLDDAKRTYGQTSLDSTRIRHGKFCMKNFQR